MSQNEQIEVVDAAPVEAAPAEATPPKAARPAKAAVQPEAAAKAEAPAAAAKTFAGKVVLDKGLAALKEANPYSKPNLEAVIASVRAATKGVGEVGSEMLAFSRQSVSDNLDAVKSLTEVRRPHDVIELQASFAKRTLDVYGAEARKMSELLSSVLKTAIVPLSDRYAVVVERLKA